MPRPLTTQECREHFLAAIRHSVLYWAKESRAQDAKERLDGLAFSILNIFDGTCVGFPAVDLVLRPHPDDKAYLIKEGENWIEDGTVINDDATLHELWAKGNP